MIISVLSPTLHDYLKKNSEIGSYRVTLFINSIGYQFFVHFLCLKSGHLTTYQFDQTLFFQHREHREPQSATEDKSMI